VTGTPAIPCCPFTHSKFFKSNTRRIQLRVKPVPCPFLKRKNNVRNSSNGNPSINLYQLARGSAIVNRSRQVQNSPAFQEALANTNPVHVPPVAQTESEAHQIENP